MIHLQPKGEKGMMKKTMIAAATSVALLSSVAMAQGSGAQTGLVVGGQLGYAKFVPYSKLPVSSPGVSGDLSNGGAYGGVLVGYDFALSPMLSVGIETGLNYGYKIANGTVTGPGPTDVDTDISTLDIPIMATVKLFPTENGFNIFAKGGFDYSKQKLTGSAGSVDVSSTDSKWRPVAAAGVGYQINALNIFAQYTYVFGTKWNDPDGSDGDTLAMNAITAGVTYTIPM